MHKDFFVELLNKYLRGEATEEESKFLLNYYDLFSDDPDVVTLMSEDQKLALQEEISNRIWADIDAAQPEKSKRRWYAISAAAMLLLACSIGFYFFRTDNTNGIVYAEKRPVPTEHSFVRLPDGTTVIVSAGSKLNYPSTFDGMKKREIYLEGQAYFDVKHNPSKPFVIHSGGVATTVLGTAFNIEAWPSARNVTVTVTRGKVRVDQEDRTLAVITPNQQVTYDKEQGSAKTTRVDADQVITWKDQDLLMNNVTVGEAAEVLETRYNVSIKISDDQFRNSRFTTTFQKDESIEKVLKSICEFSNATYTYDKESRSVVLAIK